MVSSRLVSWFLVSVAFSAAGACSVRVEEPPENEPTVATQQAFTNLGIERVIPLRIVQMAQDCVASGTACSPCSNGDPHCGPDTFDYTELQRTLQVANWSLQSLGVQFYIRSIEKLKMPLFWEIDEGNDIQWIDGSDSEDEELRTQLDLLYSGTLVFDASETLNEKNWLHAATIRAGDPREVIMFVAHSSNGGDGKRPWYGASSFTGDRDFCNSPRSFVHELGHIVGLEHTMDPFPPGLGHKIPEEYYDADWADWWNFWDLAYGTQVGGPNVYFDDLTEAMLWGFYGGTYDTIQNDWGTEPRNCTADSVTCTLTCTVGSETLVTGDPGLKGLAFTYVGDDPTAGVYRRGVNTMMYFTDTELANKFFSCPRSGFSESQTLQVRRTLRSDVRVNAADIAARLVDGYTGKRHLLGDMRGITGFSDLDFDGDGARDLAVWQPPGTPGAGATIGKFRVLLSGNGTYTQLIEKDFGIVGDVPVPADYDGDGKTDMAVVRTGGLSGDDWEDPDLHWLWCKSTALPPTDCSGSATFGDRGDVPLPGLDFDGNPGTPEIAVFDWTGSTYDYVKWRTLTSPYYQSGTILVRAVQDDVVHFHGLYDADTKTDVVFYEPRTASFFMSLSTNGYGISSSFRRSFDPALIPNAIAASSGGGAGPAATRYGGVPLHAEKNGKRVLRVFDPHTRRWYTNWNPVTSSSVGSCIYGNAGDKPLDGIIDTNLDGYSDFALYSPGTNGQAAINVRDYHSWCLGQFHTLAVNGATHRTMAAAVVDFDGSQDGRGDILLIDPDQMIWRRFNSQANGNFVEQAARPLGDLGALPL